MTDVAAAKARSALWSNTTIQNIVAGTVGGLAGVVAGHPFDTLKVRLQSKNGPSGTWQCLKSIVRQEGPLGLYRGMLSPMVGVVAVNAFLFGVYGYLLGLQSGTLAANGAPSLTHVFWAGCGSGFANAFVSCPVELAKIQLQNQSSWRGRKFRGPYDCFRFILKTHGISGCFRGMWSTIWRETPSYGFYFLAFEGIQQGLLHRKHQRYSKAFIEDELHQLPNLNTAELLFAGGMSGVAAWMSTYPMDVIKTRLQGQPLARSAPARYTSIAECARRIVAEDGWAALWRGTTATVIRAFPTNAVIFLVYSWTMQGMQRRGAEE